MKTTMTITVNGNKAGQIIYFPIEIEKSNFLNVVEMEFNSVDDVLNAEKNGEFSIVK